MVRCPTCSRELGDELICKCGTDLSLLQHIIARASHLFNQALDAYQAGQPAKALEYLKANVVLVPSDIEAWIFQAKLLAQFERWEEVETIIQCIQASEPNHPDVGILVELVAEAGLKNYKNAV